MERGTHILDAALQQVENHPLVHATHRAALLLLLRRRARRTRGRLVLRWLLAVLLLLARGRARRGAVLALLLGRLAVLARWRGAGGRAVLAGTGRQLRGTG